jgi:MFS transporter, NNP family, nitrate/nitrite transporter
MGGTAISALTTVKLVTAGGTATPFVVTAVVLAVYAGVAALLLRDAPGRVVPVEPLAQRLADTLRLRITWQAAILYAVVFGGTSRSPSTFRPT